MTTNAALFKEPPVSIADLKAQKEKVIAANVPERDANQQTKEVLKEAKNDLLSMLTKNANYVLLVANGSRTVAGYSGYKLSKENTEPKDPTVLELDYAQATTEEGEALIALKNRAGCILFLVSVLDVDGTPVLHDAFNTITFTVKGLRSGNNVLQIYGKKNDKVTPKIKFNVRVL